MLLRDLMGFAGFGLLTFGSYARFGWESACIIVGGILLTLAVIGATRK